MWELLLVDFKRFMKVRVNLRRGFIVMLANMTSGRQADP